MYRTLVADPPWEQGVAHKHPDGSITRMVPQPYASMTVAEICALPVAALSAPDSWLFLWATQRYLPDAFAVVDAWGFTYRQMIVWRKTNPQPLSVGLAISDTEFLLAARRGKPTTPPNTFPSGVIDAPRAEHSRKPECVMDYIEAGCSPPHLELFSRRARFGWDTWGDESLGHVSLG